MKIQYFQATDTLLIGISNQSSKNEADLGHGIGISVGEGGELLDIRVSGASKRLRIEDVRTSSFQWMHDPETFDFDRVLEGPWVGDNIRLDHFFEYIAALSDHLPTVCDQHRLRAERALNKDLQTMRKSEAQEYDRYRSQEIDDAVETVIPSVAWNSALVIIWSAFERALAKIVEYLEKKEPSVVAHGDLSGAKGFGKLKRYICQVSPLGRTWSESDDTHLNQFYEIRNILAHNSGILDSSGNKNKQDSIRKTISNWGGLVTDDNEVQATEKLVREALTLSDKILATLEKGCRERYGIG
jgi:uncharacterized protein YuzE